MPVSILIACINVLFVLFIIHFSVNSFYDSNRKTPLLKHQATFRYELVTHNSLQYSRYPRNLCLLLYIATIHALRTRVLFKFKFIYKAVQDTFVLTEVPRRKRVNFSSYLWRDVSEEFHAKGITC